MNLSKYSGAYIPSLDAKDLYIYSDDGYSLRRANGELNTRRFVNTLDYSLDLLKLEEVYYKVYRNSKFYININNKKYTNRVINVTFKYSCKDFNRCGGGVFVKLGVNPRTITFKDCICVRDGELVAVDTGKPVQIPLSEEALGDCFVYEDGVYKPRNNMKTVKSVRDLRAEMYENGFECDGIEYVRWKRSAGSSRVGKCLFIDKNLYSRMHRWESCGIKVKEGDAIDLATFESYISLTTSSSIDTIEINKENILVIDDAFSSFDDDVIVTDIHDGALRTYESVTTITNNIWDGQGLLDTTLFEKFGDYGMLLLRNRFFKSACFRTNIQKWFEDNGIHDVSQLNGYTLAKDIRDIKLITTPSSIKFAKFGTIQEWLDSLENTFGVVKHDKPTHFFDGRMVQIHYQLLNTLQLSYDDVKALVEPSISYLDMIKNDPAVLRYHIKYPDNVVDMEDGCATSNDIVFKLLGINNKFYNTQICRNFVRKIIKSYYKDLRCGHILVNGNYSTLFGNPIEMLKEAVGKFDGTSTIEKGSIYSRRFYDGCKLLGTRSPHVTMGNILIADNKYNELIDKYFKLTDEIVCINSIGDNILERLSGADFDSDTMLITDNAILINAAMANYDKFKVPTNLTHAKKTKRTYSAEQLTDLDIKTSVNLIGEIVNFSQELNSLFWNNIHNGESFDDNAELYMDICQLDVMSTIEIDSAKREFEISNKRELKKLKDKYKIVDDDTLLPIKPKFFEMLSRNKGYDITTKHYKKFDTSMDYLQRIIRGVRLTQYKDKQPVPFSDIINKDGYSRAYVKINQVNTIISLVRGYKVLCINTWSNDRLSSSEKMMLCEREKQEIVDIISGMKMSKDTMIKLLLTIEYPENKDVAKIIFDILFSSPHKDFFALIKESAEPQDMITECVNHTDIKIFDFSFAKVKNPHKTLIKVTV